MGQPTWSAELIETAKKCAFEGLSAAQIAKVIGKTRNAILGKLFRMGINLPNDHSGHKPATPKQPKPKVRSEIFTPRASREDATFSMHLARCDGVEFFDLKPHHCRWPYGTSNYYFCGRRRAAGSPYCFGHSQMAFVKQDRRGGDGFHGLNKSGSI